MSNAPACIPAQSCAYEFVPRLDGCCQNTPGGHFLQTQFWDPSPALGGNETWTIHGLWPDHCDGTFDMYCNDTRHRSPEQITQILSEASTASSDADVAATHEGLLQYMMKHWLSNDARNANLWAHEWNKHGTCISTIEEKCYDRDQGRTNAPERTANQDVLDYFSQAVMLYTTLPTFEFFAEAGIVPSRDKTYELAELEEAIRHSPHGIEATIRCRNHDELAEIWYSFNVKAELRYAMDLWWDGNKQWNSWIPTTPKGKSSNCPAKGIRYVPKDVRKPSPTPSPTSTTATHTVTPTSQPSKQPFTGKGRLMVKVLSKDHDALLDKLEETTDDDLYETSFPHGYTGCLIRRGTWYATKSLTSCAIFTAEDDVKHSAGDDAPYHLFTLSSRYAPCSFIPPNFPTDLSHEKNQHALTPLDSSAKFFSCAPTLPVQTIFSNNATLDERHSENARRLTLGEEHQYRFWAADVPRRNGQVGVWTDNGGGARQVEVVLEWVGV